MNYQITKRRNLVIIGIILLLTPILWHVFSKAIITVELDDVKKECNADSNVLGTHGSSAVHAFYANLVANLKIVIASENLPVITSTISKAMQTARGVEAMKRFLGDKTFSINERKLVAETLIRAGTANSARIVVTAATIEIELGYPDDGSTILSTLKISDGVQSAEGLLSVLLGNDTSGCISYPLPFEVQSVLQKTLRNSSDVEEVGSLMARLYSELIDSGKEFYANELLNGVAQPEMLSKLLAQANTQGKSDEVTELFERLIATDHPGVVGALARLASKEPALLNNASVAMFNWSFDHSDHLQIGLFAEYINNQKLPPQQRVVAAYGLAGLIGKADAGRALEKSILSETNQFTRACLQNALASLQEANTQESENLPSTK